jgi:hypothetical protein
MKVYRLFQKHQEYQQDASQDNQCEKNRENQIIWPTSHTYWQYNSYTPNSKSYSNNFSSTTAPVARIRSGAVSPGGAPFHGVDSPREDLVRTAVLPQSWTSTKYIWKVQVFGDDLAWAGTHRGLRRMSFLWMGSAHFNTSSRFMASSGLRKIRANRRWAL